MRGCLDLRDVLVEQHWLNLTGNKDVLLGWCILLYLFISFGEGKKDIESKKGYGNVYNHAVQLIRHLD